MRWCLSVLLFCFLAVAHALSSSGNRLLVVLEDADDKGLYSTFWGDLEGMDLGSKCALMGETLTPLFLQRVDMTSTSNRPRALTCPCSSTGRRPTTIS